MQRPRPSRSTLGFVLALAVTAWFVAGTMVQSGSIPWTVLVAATAVTFVHVGPLAWLARARLSARRRKQFGVSAVVVGAIVLVVLAVSQGISPLNDAIVLGFIAGTTLVVLVEKALLPDRLRGFLDEGAESSDDSQFTRSS